jgi:DNA-binding CsgD family transcriptional regulator
MIITSGTSPACESRLVALSDREAQVAALTYQGNAPCEISELLGIAESTARTYVHQLCQGLHLRGAKELMIWVGQNPGAITADPKARVPGRSGLHPRNCGCAAPYCSLTRTLKKAA